MATAESMLVDAIKRIAGVNPEVLDLLRQIQKRGGIDGIKTQLGGDDGTGAEQSCCGNPNDPPPPPPPPPPLGGDAPSNLGGGTPPGWNDCTTGQPIQFTPGGFPQPETCKECERPDPTWEQGYYWIVSLGSRWGPFATAGFSDGAQLCISDYNADGPVNTNITLSSNSGLEEIATGYRWYAYGVDNDSGDDVTVSGYASKTPCGSSAASYCTVTEPPIIHDCKDWESDNTTSYTLANGCIVASTCDPDASAAAQACNECITICNADGQERRICSIGNGQWILYDPAGKYKGGRYDATGRRLEILPAGETGGYLPSEAYDGSYDGGTIGGGGGWVWS